MLRVRATHTTTEERVTLTVEERPSIPRLVVTEPAEHAADYIDIGHFLEDWTRVVREDAETAPDA